MIGLKNVKTDNILPSNDICLRLRDTNCVEMFSDNKDNTIAKSRTNQILFAISLKPQIFFEKQILKFNNSSK